MTGTHALPAWIQAMPDGNWPYRQFKHELYHLVLTTSSYPFTSIHFFIQIWKFYVILLQVTLIEGFYGYYKL
jgi:hypothetical protein